MKMLCVIMAMMPLVCFADGRVNIYEREALVEVGDMILLTNVSFPDVDVVDRAYINLVGTVKFGIYDVDPDYQTQEILRLKVVSNVFSGATGAHDTVRYEFMEEGLFYIQVEYHNAEFLTMGDNITVQFTTMYSSDISGVPIIDPYLVDFTAVLVVEADDQVYAEVMSIGDVKERWK